MNYLFLNFTNAGWYDSDKTTTDYVFDIKGQTKRNTLQKYVEPINVYHISNVLHVLMGERPVPSLRYSIFKINQHIFDIALNSYLKINDYQIEVNNSKNILFKEKQRTKKAVWNADDPQNDLVYWKRLNIFLGDEMYNEYIDIVKKVQMNHP